MTFDARRALMEASGYEVRFRDGEWSECLILRGEETWHGRGRDRPSAFDAAMRAACPSHIARMLLDAEVHRHAASATLDVDRDTLDLRGALEQTRAAMAQSKASITGGDEAVHTPEVLTSHPSAPAWPAGENGAAALSAPAATPIAGPIDAMPARNTAPRIAPLRTHSSPPPLVRRDVAPMRMDPPRAMEELDILMERIRDSREELGLCAPERQRLAMLAWICEARAHTDTFPDDIRIRDRVGAISRQLTEIGKTFWPGSVTALQLQMQPRDLPRHVLGGPASTWARAAELAERALRSQEYSDERRGFDAYGWSDAPSTLPPPIDPLRLFDDLAGEVERFGGALPPNAVPREVDARPDPDSFRRWIRTLRWLRLSDVDPDRWARIAGRLRWWACHREAPLAAAARELEASYSPEQPWAKELGIEEASNEAPNTSDLPQLASRRFPEEVLENIRSAMSGKRMVFVSNRRDPDLQTRLKDALPSATLDWRVAEPKRLEALGEAIQQGAYDVVLGAIGFQSQGTDHLLARACRQAGVKYLRVNRGRPIACLRALARELQGAA